MSGKPSQTSGGLKAKPTTESQAPESVGAKLEKVNSLKEVLEKQNTRYTYAIVRARRNVVISVINRNGFLKVNIATVLDRRPVSGFDVRHLKKVIIALNDLYNDILGIKPDIEKQESKTKSNVKVY
jgi:DNA-directed RNA polymerase subunit K/omega